ncbi:hypothetical protein [Lactiplantibacillus plantarum]
MNMENFGTPLVVEKDNKEISREQFKKAMSELMKNKELVGTLRKLAKE